jgi:hypothetical protein
MTRQPGNGLSFRDVAADDELLDRLGGRRGTPPATDPDDQVLRLLTALVHDVDHGLPRGIDPQATELLTARIAGRPVAPGWAARSAPVAPVPVAPVPVAPAPVVPAPSAVRRPHRRSTNYVASHRAARTAGPRGAGRQAVTLTRGGAVAASLATVVASAGVSAAVTGDPAGAFGLRTLSSMVLPDRWVGSAQAQWLGRRIDLAARRPGGPDGREVAELRAQAARLPAAQASRLQQKLDSLAPQVSAAASPVPAESPVPTEPTPGETADPTGPAGGDPTDPAGGDPTGPAGGDPTDPAGGDPTDPAGGDPTDPADGDPEPDGTQTGGGTGEPTRPKPTRPKPTKPTKPKPTRPGPTRPGPIRPEPIKPEPIEPTSSESGPTRSELVTDPPDVVPPSRSDIGRPMLSGRPSRPWLPSRAR